MKASIKVLSTEGLYLLTEDVEKRIGSHVAGGDVVSEYVDGQREILDEIQKELIRRMGNE